jgi:hypothetical protein
MVPFPQTRAAAAHSRAFLKLTHSELSIASQPLAFQLLSPDIRLYPPPSRCFLYECETAGVMEKGSQKLLKTKRRENGNCTTEFAEDTESGGKTDQSRIGGTAKLGVNQHEREQHLITYMSISIYQLSFERLANGLRIQAFSSRQWLKFNSDVC